MTEQWHGKSPATWCSPWGTSMHLTKIFCVTLPFAVKALQMYGPWCDLGSLRCGMIVECTTCPPVHCSPTGPTHNLPLWESGVVFTELSKKASTMDIYFLCHYHPFILQKQYPNSSFQVCTGQILITAWEAGIWPMSKPSRISQFQDVVRGSKVSMASNQN